MINSEYLQLESPDMEKTLHEANFEEIIIINNLQKVNIQNYDIPIEMDIIEEDEEQEEIRLNENVLVK